jgi:uncharacterized protein (TIRG00374 family)
MRYRPLLTLAGLLASVVFVFLAVRNLDFAATRQTLASAKFFPWVPLGAACYLLGHLVRGQRLRILLRRESTLPWLTATNIVVIGYACNNVLPARLGELVRAGVLVDRTGLPFGETLTITVIERLLDGIAILLFLVTIVALGGAPGWMTRLADVGGVVFGGALLIVLTMVVFPNFLLALTARVAAPLKPAARDRVVRLATYVIHGAACFRRPRTAVLVSLLSVLVWALEASLFACILPAFQLPLHWKTGVLAMAVTNLGILVPSTPGYVGPFHHFCSQVLLSQGVSPSTAMGYAVLVHLAFYVPITVWGAAAILRYGIEVGSMLATARAAQASPTKGELSGVPVHLIARTEAPARTEKADRWMLAVAESLVPRPCTREVLNSIAVFMTEQIAALPPPLRTLFHLGMTLFRVQVRVRCFRPFCALPLERRRNLLEEWAFGPLALLRQLFRPVRTLALFAYYEHPQVAKELARRSRGSLALLQTPLRQHG